MDKTEEVIYFTFIPWSVGVSFIIFAFWLLPENCSLFISNVPGPQMCHTIPMPDYCNSFCKDTNTELFASVIAGVGISLFFVPAFIYFILDLRQNFPTSEQYNLFQNEKRK